MPPPVPPDCTSPIAPLRVQAPERPPWSLVRVYPERDELVLRLEDRALVIGRGDPAAVVDLPLADPRASRRHVEVRAERDGVEVRDLGSTNGTFVDGARVQAARIGGGQVLRVGDSLFVLCKARPKREPDDLGMVSQSGELARVREIIRRVAPSSLPVLIEGRTGTGKELIAQAIHKLSKRKGPLVPVNCAALPANLVESCLFGHRRGAFTGAAADQEGAFRAAHGGTLFLDEIGDLPLEAQPKLLRVLESGEVTPVGSTQPLRVDVRVVAATNVALYEAVAAGRFREDLLARLLGVRILVPPLSQRREDILLLLKRMLADEGCGLRPTVTAAEALLLHDWPRNIRELRQMARRLSVMHGDHEWLEVDQLGEDIQPRVSEPQDDLTQTTVRPLGGPPGREELLQLLQECDGNVSEVARRAGRSRKQVYRWLETMGLERSPES